MNSNAKLTSMSAMNQTNTESKNNFEQQRGVSFSKVGMNNEGRIDSPDHGYGGISKHDFLSSVQQNKAAKITSQKSRSRIRGNLRRNIQQTFSQESI